MNERTLVILKPDAVQRGIMGEIISRFERVGLKMVGAKMITPTKELLNRHYPTDRREFIEGMGRKTIDNNKEMGLDTKEHFGHDDPYKIGLELQKWLMDYMTSGPALAMVLEGPHSIEMVRKMRGHTLPQKALPGTITGDYSYDSSTLANAYKRSIRNLVHASGNAEEAEFEIGLWFSESEIYDYETIHQKHMRG